MSEGLLWLWWLLLFPIFVGIVILIAVAQRKTSLEKIIFFVIPVGLFICVVRGIDFWVFEIRFVIAILLMAFVIYTLGRSITLWIGKRAHQSKKRGEIK